MTLSEIERALRTGEMNLDDAVRSGEIPGHILRHFACDCAEIALRRERARGREHDPRSWDALRVSRQFAEGCASKKDLFTAWNAARAAARAAARSAWNAAWSLAGSARDAAWEAEKKVQAALLADWIALYLEERAKLIRLLKSLLPSEATQFWREETEGGMF